MWNQEKALSVIVKNGGSFTALIVPVSPVLVWRKYSNEVRATERVSVPADWRGQQTNIAGNGPCELYKLVIVMSAPKGRKNSQYSLILCNQVSQKCFIFSVVMSIDNYFSKSMLIKEQKNLRTHKSYWNPWNKTTLYNKLNIQIRKTTNIEIQRITEYYRLACRPNELHSAWPPSLWQLPGTGLFYFN